MQTFIYTFIPSHSSERFPCLPGGINLRHPKGTGDVGELKITNLVRVEDSSWFSEEGNLKERLVKGALLGVHGLKKVHHCSLQVFPQPSGFLPPRSQAVVCRLSPDWLESSLLSTSNRSAWAQKLVSCPAQMCNKMTVWPSILIPKAYTSHHTTTLGHNSVTFL